MFHHVESPVLEQFSSLSGIDAWSLLSSEEFACNSKMMNDHSLIVSDGHMDHPSFITMKTQGMEEVVLGSKDINHYFLNDSVASELIVEHPVEVPNEDPYAEIILVPNTVIKQEDVIEGGEIVIGSTDGNEVTIDEDDQIDVHLDPDSFAIGSSIDICSDQIEENAFDDTKLVIDMETESYSLEALPSVAFDCVNCGIVLKSRAALKKHIKSQHTRPRKTDRDKKKVTTSLNNIKEEKYLTDKRYTCPSCTYSSRRRDKLDKHMEKHVLLDGVHPCGKRRHKPQALPQRHRHNAEEYRCPYCPYSCTVYKALRKHQKVHSSGSDTFTLKLSCKICGKDRSTEFDMQKHMRKHKNDEHFLCDLCNFSSVQLKKIIQHRRMHTGEKPHLCPHCSYRSARRDNLRSHVRRMHKRQNMYIDTFNPNEETAVNITY